MAQRRILLVDCDAYFVQVARLADPDGAGREPLLLVGGSAAGRGVITSASYECRPFGVRSGMPTAHALRLCPKAKVVPVPRGECSRLHGEIRAVLEAWAPVVAAASIDEFYLDMTGTERLYHDAPLADVAQRVRDAVLDSTRISVSIGGGSSRLVAKMAVAHAKPAGVHIVAAGGEAEFLRGFALRAIPGIGPKAEERLARMGLRTVADAVDLGRDALLGLVGRSFGEWLWRRAHGLDSSRISRDREARSISRDETFARDITDDEALERELLRLATRAAADLRSEALRARTITVRIRDADFRNRSASRTLPEGVESDRPIYEVARALLARLRARRRVPARLLSVALTHFEGAAGGVQLGMFEDDAAAPETERERRLARALDRIRAKHGTESIRSARLGTGPGTQISR